MRGPTLPKYSSSSPYRSSESSSCWRLDTSGDGTGAFLRKSQTCQPQRGKAIARAHSSELQSAPVLQALAPEVLHLNACITIPPILSQFLPGMGSHDHRTGCIVKEVWYEPTDCAGSKFQPELLRQRIQVPII